jgi:sirohydrochlorin ferrochelatase
MTPLVICSHGTRSAVGAARVTRFVATVAEALPGVEVQEAHVDVHPPYLDDVISRDSVVVPLLLAAGHHVHVDIAAAASRVGAQVTAALGPDRVLTSLLTSRLRRLGPPLQPDDVVVLAAAGSTFAGSGRDTEEAARALSAGLGRLVHVGYGAASTPRLDDLVVRLRRLHPGQRIVAASYLLTPGHFHDRVLACRADDVTDPLLDEHAPDPRLVELVIDRYLHSVSSRLAV